MITTLLLFLFASTAGRSGPAASTPLRPASHHRIAGRVVYARPDRGVGVHIEQVEQDRYARLIAVPPPSRRAAR